MGEHADDCIDAGMATEFPFGRTYKPRKIYPKKVHTKKVKLILPNNVDNDHFTWWFDETEQSTNMEEVASMAWFTVISRFKLKYVPDCLDKYGFHDWLKTMNFAHCSPYEIADMAWMKAKDLATEYYAIRNS